MNGNPYVTYIEKKYIQKCEKNGNSADVKSDWESKKLLYREMTKTTIYEFMNYSLHDESHSIHILESIEMVLGRQRINDLSRSDLWLLLNAAYAHDIGMVTEYKKLEDLWSSEAFRNYLKETRDSLNKDDASAAKFYGLLNDFLLYGAEKGACQPPSGINFKMHDAWPLEFRKDITLLMSNYIRNRHGELTREFFENPENTNNYIVEDRLYKLIGRIASCHTQGQSSVEELPCRCKGFGTDWMHPRFVATLLRLGDLLDLDNNRFDIFSMKHFGTLPDISVAHYKRHKSITHFHIEPKVIEITAKSDDFEVCKLNQIWFQYLRDDIKYLITHWSIVAPKKLKGCLLGLPKLEVFHGNSRFTESSMTRFVLEKQKLLRLFTGNNLYSSNLAFIREYMQNAFDASRLQLFYELLPIDKDSHKISFSSQAEVYLQNPGVDLKKLKPFDLNSTAFETFAIIITIKPDPKDSGKFILQITDRGIGIDKEGIEAIVNVGSGWERRNNHKRAIKEMREWMRPTGGFGIGLQSAYLITDEARLYTKSSFEEGRCIILSEYSNEKNVLVEIDRDNLYRGTTAQFRIDFSKMQQSSIIEQFFKKNLDDFDAFSLKGKLEIVYHIIAEYVRKTFPMSLFPIKMQLLNEEGYEEIPKNTIVGPYLCIDKHIMGEKGKVPLFHNCGRQSSADEKLSVIEKRFYDFIRERHDTPGKVYFHLYGERLYVWDDGPQILYSFSLPAGKESVNVLANYKNVLVQDNTKSVLLSNTKHPEFLETAYDVMGLIVEKCLVVSRNKFREDASAQEQIRIDLFTRAYAHLLLHMAIENNTQIPGGILLNACLIESDKELVKRIMEKCKTVLSDQTYTSWCFDFDKGKWEMDRKLISASSMLEMLPKTVVMAEIGNPEEKSGQSEFTCGLLSEQNGICLHCGDGSSSQTEPVLDKDSAIISDKKIYEILARYGEKQPEIIVNFYDSMTKQPMKAYIINTGLETISGSIPGQRSGSRSPSQKKKDIDHKNTFKRRYMAVDLAENDVFSPLVVSHRPFGIEDSETYIITPYSFETGMLIEKMLIDDQVSKRTKQLIRMIEQDSSYEELCQWVYHNQKSGREKKYTISEIKEAYRELIRRDIETRCSGTESFDINMLRIGGNRH